MAQLFKHNPRPSLREALTKLVDEYILGHLSFEYTIPYRGKWWVTIKFRKMDPESKIGPEKIGDPQPPAQLS